MLCCWSGSLQAHQHVRIDRPAQKLLPERPAQELLSHEFGCPPVSIWRVVSWQWRTKEGLTVGG